ncbi:hypothetical protein [Desulfovibrio sp.]|uniref:secretion/conjugation apparatus DotM-related subunit n=1 Tax=Desulfovibrio sp. TaxID=885 RepID=UPI0025BBBE1E|nr:hypothetical protein [Desulfovibrio sp.]
MSQNREDLDDHMFLWVVLLLIVLVVIPAIYVAKAGYINGWLLSLSKTQLKAFVPFSAEAQTAWEHISGLDPDSLTWERMQGVLTYTGKWVRWPFALLLVMLGAASIYMGRTRGLMRRLNMESLLQHNAESFACLRPIVGRGKYLLSPESYDSGLWRIARSPVQFALEHGLLLDENGTPFTLDQALRNGLASVELPAYGRAWLDEKKALAVLQEQLGPVFSGFEALSPGRRALAAAFLSYAAGEKKECVGILDVVSNSYTETDGTAACPVLERGDFAKRLAKPWERHQVVLSEKSLTRHTSYELPWFMALLTRARQKGVLASSQFLWLRPLDRSLWYALNQCGGRAAWAEAFAAWAHYVAEEKAGRALHEPHVAPAVVSLRDSLSGQGWLADTPRAAGTPDDTPNVAPQTAPDSGDDSTIISTGSGSAAIEPMPDVVLADAEDDPEMYDANSDPHLAQEQY